MAGGAHESRPGAEDARPSCDRRGGPAAQPHDRDGRRPQPRGRIAAQRAEWRLRDELRAPRLLDDAVRAAVDALRRRGSTVTILDEGGLEELDEHELVRVRGELAEALRATTSPRVFVRSAPNPRIAVTVVGRATSSVGLSDEDTVELWREIARPPR